MLEKGVVSELGKEVHGEAGTQGPCQDGLAMGRLAPGPRTQLVRLQLMTEAQTPSCPLGTGLWGMMRHCDRQLLCLFNVLQARPPPHPAHSAVSQGGGRALPSPGTKAPGGCSRPAGHRRTEGGTLTADATSKGRVRGQASGGLLHPRTLPSWPREAQRGARQEEGRPHLPPLRDRHRGRQEKVCFTRASSGSGR